MVCSKPLFSLLAAIILLAQLSQCASKADFFETSEEDVSDEKVESEPAIATRTIAGFNESCSEATCNEQKNLKCNNNVCECAKENQVYITDTEGCEEIARTDTNGNCQHDAQCQVGKWGALSRCEKSTKRCQCYDYPTGGKREVHYFEHEFPNEPYCYLRKAIGDSCSTYLECNRGIEGEAICSDNECRCADGWVWDKLQCLKVWDGDKDFKCKSNEQCKQSKMGNLSRCDKTTSDEDGKCECWDSSNSGNEDQVVWYPETEKCYKKKEMGSNCEAHEECIASIHGDAECRGLDSSSTSDISPPLSRTCQCKEGKTCDPNGASELAKNVQVVSFIVLAIGARFMY